MGNFIVNILNNLISMIGETFTFLVNLLPQSPFNTLVSIDKGWFPNLNWFFPVTEIVAILQLWVTAVGFYYLLMVPLRWVKVLE